MTGRIKEAVLLFLKGGGIGVANIIPGVSGGTMAVVFGIYDRLIRAIAGIFETPRKWKEHAPFLAVIVAGAGASILLLADLMDHLLTHHYQPTLFTFMGLIIGGIPVLWKSHKDMKPGALRILFFLLGMLVVIIPILLGPEGKEAAKAGAEGAVASGGSGLLLLAGFLAGGAMIVPGVSGSFILVLMGQYAVIIAAISARDVLPLGIVAVGAGTGVLAFSKIIKLCLLKAPSTTYYFILGLLVASIGVIYPGIPSTGGGVAASLVLLVLGAAASYLTSRISTA